MRRVLPRKVVRQVAALFPVAIALLYASPLSAQSLGGAFDAYVRESMSQWGVPGLVVIVVKDDRTLHSTGYGTRVAGAKDPIDDDTWLQIASNSKAFAATTVAMLVDRGKLGWNDPVRKYIPEFALADSIAAAQLTVLDLALHRGGLPRMLGEIEDPSYGIRQLLNDLRPAPLIEPLRGHQTYSNVNSALLGEIVARVSGMSWEDFVRREIFVPLGMTASYTSNPDLFQRFEKASRNRNMMLPARKQKGVVSGADDWTGVGTNRLYAPAGGITTTAADLEKWLRLLVNDGRYGTNALLSSAALQETRRPGVVIDPILNGLTLPVSPLAAGSPGWLVLPYAGRLLYEGLGAWMSSVVALVPEDRLAVAVVSNAYFTERAPWESVHFVSAIAMRAVDAALGMPAKDWLTEFERTVAVR